MMAFFVFLLECCWIVVRFSFELFVEARAASMLKAWARSKARLKNLKVHCSNVSNSLSFRILNKFIDFYKKVISFNDLA